MNSTSNVVSIHPYFKAHVGKLDACKALMPAFIQRTQDEEKNLYYEFTINGDEIFCREGYTGAEGVLTHLANVGPLLEQLLKIANLTRLEMHGPAIELEKLKGPMADLKPVWFVSECGVSRE